MSTELNFYCLDDIASLLNQRAGETKIGEVLCFAQHTDFNALKRAGIEYVLLGLPEDIGPRANLGNGGARHGWRAFLKSFINLQHNSFIPTEKIALLGELDFSDLHKVADQSDTTLETLRNLCCDIDQRVSELLEGIFDAQLIPIIIGGGHNNAYPIIKACSTSEELPLAVANLDPHSDFRAQEGRHSGNPFRYAAAEQLMSRYMVLGLHEQKNNEDALNAMQQHDFRWISIQDSHWSKKLNFDQCLEDCARYLMHSGLPIGVELDVDCIANMPASAITTAGMPYEDALYYVTEMAMLPRVKYLHLAEAAPDCESPQEMRAAGQILSELVCAFIKTDHQKKVSEG